MFHNVVAMLTTNNLFPIQLFYRNFQAGFRMNVRNTIFIDLFYTKQIIISFSPQFEDKNGG